MNWERDFTLRWWSATGELRHERPVGLRINGNWSRNMLQKSLRLYFDHHGQPNTIEGAFFGAEVEEFEHLILRGASQRPDLFINDVLAVEIFAELGHR